MQDQLQYWNDAHSKRQLHAHSLKQTSFAEEVNKAIPAKSTILELGCGEGNDSIYFAEQGHTVEATDFSPTVIDKNRISLPHDNLHFSVQDISARLRYDDGSFGVVYARLSLHYFTDEVTRKIFKEIARVLKPDGYLCFMCKSIDDKLYGQGKQLEADMFELNGHVRHFFSENYARELLAANGFKIETIEKSEGKLYWREAAFIKIVAKRTA